MEWLKVSLQLATAEKGWQKGDPIFLNRSGRPSTWMSQGKAQILCVWRMDMDELKILASAGKGSS